MSLSGELPYVEPKTLFASKVQKKQAELESQKIIARIQQLKQEHEKLVKKINQSDQKAQEIYQHRVELQLKKEEKMKKKIQPPPFSLAVSRHQKEVLKRVVDENINRKQFEAKVFRDMLKQNHIETINQKQVDRETYRTKVMQIKEEERLSNSITQAKLKDKRDRVRYEVEFEKDRTLQEKLQYDLMIQELERQESEAILRIQQTMDREKSIIQKVNQAQSLPPKDFEKIYGHQQQSRSNHIVTSESTGQLTNKQSQ